MKEFYLSKYFTDEGFLCLQKMIQTALVCLTYLAECETVEF